MARWLWAQGSANRTTTAVATMLSYCQQYGFTDIAFLAQTTTGVLWNSSYFTATSERTSGQFFLDYLSQQANAVGIRVHGWVTVAYWQGIWALRLAGLPSSWNAANVYSGWEWGNQLDLANASVQTACGAMTEDMLSNVSGIAGIHLDYIRNKPGVYYTSGHIPPSAITTCVSNIRTEANLLSKIVTIAGVPAHANGTVGYNFDIEGCSQPWDDWISDDVIDYTLLMNYDNPAGLETQLTSYVDTMSATVRAGVVNGYAPYWWRGDDSLLSYADFEELGTITVNHGYDLAIFDYDDIPSSYWAALPPGGASPTRVYTNDANLEGLWYLEEASGTRYDVTANNNDLTDNNTVTRSTDYKQGTYSAEFVRTNSEYLSIADGSQTGLDITGNITICAWIKSTAIIDTVIYRVASKFNTVGNQRGYQLQIIGTASGAAQVIAWLSSDGAASTYAASAVDVVDSGVWTHIAFVYDGTDIRIYVNGSFSSSATNPQVYSSGIFNNTAAFQIGGRDGDSNYFYGLIDEVAVFSRALSSSEIYGVYVYGIDEEPVSSAVYKDDANLIALWLLEETSGTRYDYTTNNNDLSATNMSYSVNAQEGTYSADFEYDSNAYLEITDVAQTGLDITGNLTIVAWVRVETKPGSMVVASKYNTASSQRGYMLYMAVSATNLLTFNVSANGSTFSTVVGTTDLANSTWYHVAGRYNGTNIEVFVNGQPNSSSPTAHLTGIYSNTANFRLGRHAEDVWQLDGLLDEVAIFNRALSDAEIEDVYLNGIQEPVAGAIIPIIVYHLKQQGISG